MPKERKTVRSSGRRYTIFFVADQDTGGYTVHVPALGIVTEGETLAEGTAMAKDAIAGWIEAAKELGKPIPEDVACAQVEVTA